MRIAVCLKSVPSGPGEAWAGEESRALNEWDAYALEEALALAERQGGEVTALAAGGEETEPCLRRALALGAARACRIAADGDDPHAVSRGIAAFCAASPQDVLFFGAQSSDRGGGQVGGTVAALLRLPFASLVTRIDGDAAGLLVEREIESRRHERYTIFPPCALSVQTGINQPRYVSVRGIQRAGRLPVELFTPQAPAAAGVTFVRALPPEKGHATMLAGDAQGMAEELAAIIRARRGL